MFCGSGGSKSTLAKLYAVVARSTCDVRITSGSSGSDVEKVHTAVARSMFPSQHVQKTPRSEHFWKLKCPKSTRGCGAKHISKSKCEKNIWSTFGSCDVQKAHVVLARSTFRSENAQSASGLRALLEVQMSKRARRFEHIRKSKVLKTGGLGALFELS